AGAATDAAEAARAATETRVETEVPPGRDQVATVAALDVVGLTVTVIAAVLLAVTDVTHIGWWVALVALAAAALTGAVTTMILVRLIAKRRAYITKVKKAALRLESHRDLRPGSSDLRDAESLRDEAIEFGEEELAARLNTVINSAYATKQSR